MTPRYHRCTGVCKSRGTSISIFQAEQIHSIPFVFPSRADRAPIRISCWCKWFIPSSTCVHTGTVSAALLHGRVLVATGLSYTWWLRWL